MCKYYNHEVFISVIAAESVAFAIVAINLILKKVIIDLI